MLLLFVLLFYKDYLVCYLSILKKNLKNIRYVYELQIKKRIRKTLVIPQLSGSHCKEKKTLTCDFSSRNLRILCSRDQQCTLQNLTHFQLDDPQQLPHRSSDEGIKGTVVNRITG